MATTQRALLAGVALSWMSACGEVQELSTDASVAGNAPARCSPTASFGAPTALTSLNTTADDERAELSADELTIYFSSSRPGGVGGFDIYKATRTSITAPFGNVILVPGMNTTGNERGPRVTPDGLSMYVYSTAAGVAGQHIMLASRTGTTLPFSGLQVLAKVNGTTDDVDPYLLQNGNVLYFTSNRAGNYGLYRSSKIAGAFSTPLLVSGDNLDSASLENSPVVTPDELTLYFSSDRPGGLGSLDIYTSTRSTTADAFGAPIALTSVNTASTDTPTWVSPDGCALYFSRAETNVGYQLYVAMRGR
jgi:Tol biopolymer transport system component